MIIEKINQICAEHNLTTTIKDDEISSVIWVIKLLLSERHITTEFIKDNQEELNQFNIFYNQNGVDGLIIVDDNNVVTAKGTNIVMAFNKAKVNACECASVLLFDRSTCICHDTTTIYAYDKSNVYSNCYGKIYGFNKSKINSKRCDTIFLYDDSFATTNVNCKVFAQDNSHVISYGSYIEAVDNARIDARTFEGWNWFNTIVYGNGNVKIIDDGKSDIKLYNNAKIVESF